jgi:hypothetical protein
VTADDEPPERGETVRQSLRAALERDTWTARELSAEVSIREREVAQHLEHLARSLPREGAELVVEPARCVPCGFAFRKRDRLAAPSRCPKCRSERIEPPRFHVERG